MEMSKWSGAGVPAVVYGPPSERAYLFVHGRCGRKEEAEAFAALACGCGCQVVTVDLPGHGERSDMDRFVPWCAVPELRGAIDAMRRQWRSVSLSAVSIGAWFAMLAFMGDAPDNCLLVSPVLDMRGLIESSMRRAQVTPEQLARAGEIRTGSGETLSYQYYRYAVEHPILEWGAPTAILYAGGDGLTPRETVETFAERFSCRLTVMERGEHWFHTPEQLAVLHDFWNAAL